MPFNLNDTLADMMQALKKHFDQDWPLIKTTAHQFLQARISRLALLAELRLKNQLPPGFFAERMKDEELLLQSELHAITIVTAASAQKAARAAMQIFMKAISKAIVL
ncbi:MAG: hypothetical protein FGM61_13765 [Sediminibacterium sp.]|nr:hypothetical protein [Sediminibacterium sp.]